MPQFVKLATVGDVPENSVRAFSHGGAQVAIYRCNGVFYATSNICTHDYAELHQGWLDSDDCAIECPLHGARFDLASGAVRALPAYQPLPTYPVRVEGDDILVGIDE